MARRKLIVAVATLALIAGGGALAVASTSVHEQPQGAQFACVKPGGQIAYMQFRRPGDPGYHAGTPECYDGPGGVTQWEWSKEGPQGPQGDPGPQGEPGQDGVSGYEVVGRTADAVTVPAGETMDVPTLCPEGSIALGGGATLSEGGVLGTSAPDGIEQVSEPTEDDPAGVWGARGWTVTVTAGDTAVSVQPYVTCADVA